LDPAAINHRLDAVEELARGEILRGDVRDMIRGINDIERLVSRCAAGLASARDLVGLKESLNRLPRLCDLLTDCRIDSLRGICARLGSSDHRPPTTDIFLL